MKLEVGKKYRIEDSDRPWEVVAIDGGGVAWGLVNGVMRHCLFVNVISEWDDEPDPGEGWRLLHPDEDLETGDEFYLKFDDPYFAWTKVNCSNNKQTPGMFYRRRIAPQYVPYTWDDREELRGRWYRKKGDNVEVLVTHLTKQDSTNVSINSWSSDAFLLCCEWLDGTPCGKKVV